MTAEIAILNKSAVALAADSAVTIGRPPNAKVYNTVNKIFELSSRVGIMVYGRLDYMGLPFETIIKEYRRELPRDKPFAKVADYANGFRDYLLKNVPVNQKDETLSIGLIISSALSNIDTIFERSVRYNIAEIGFKPSKLNGYFQAAVNTEIARLKTLPDASGFTRRRLAQKYDGLVDVLADQVISGVVLTDQSKKLLRQWAVYLLVKQPLSNFRSGIVVAGFGAEEWCPSLLSFETDGVIGGRLKYVESPPVDIGRHGPEAEILGFAQDDVMKSFYQGIDPIIRGYTTALVEQAIIDTSRSVLSAVLNNKDKEAAAFELMRPTLEQMQADAKKKGDNYIERVAVSPIRDMISAMPKQELAKLAESLIELTSLKRKVTRGQETVGGDVDVAIISKSEGFIWTKRKHYFPPVLNPSFFERHYKQ